MLLLLLLLLGGVLSSRGGDTKVLKEGREEEEDDEEEEVANPLITPEFVAGAASSASHRPPAVPLVDWSRTVDREEDDALVEARRLTISNEAEGDDSIASRVQVDVARGQEGGRGLQRNRDNLNL